MSDFPNKVTDEDIAKLEAALEQRLRDRPEKTDRAIWQRPVTFYELGSDEDGCVSWDCDHPHWGYERILYKAELHEYHFEHLVRLPDHRLSQVWTPMSPEDRERVIRDLLADRLIALRVKSEIEE